MGMDAKNANDSVRWEFFLKVKCEVNLANHISNHTLGYNYFERTFVGFFFLNATHPRVYSLTQSNTVNNENAFCPASDVTPRTPSSSSAVVWPKEKEKKIWNDRLVPSKRNEFYD